MAHDAHHEHLIAELAEQLEPVLSNSSQAIYLYLDDEHKTCNQEMANMLGYKSVEEWVNNETPLDDVLESDQNKVVDAYMSASRELKASTFNVTVVRKDDKQIDVEVIMVPISYKDEVFVLHFISSK